MKNRRILTVVLFVLTAALPAAKGLSACSNYTFELVSYPLFAVVIAGVAVVLCAKTNNGGGQPMGAPVTFLLAPLAVINMLVFVWTNRSIFTFSALLLCAGCCAWLTFQNGRPPLLKRLSLALTFLLALPALFLCGGLLLFGGIGSNTVVRTATSPGDQYIARVINSDQGALGGDTFVDVYEQKGVNGGFFTVTPKPRTVYVGEWGEFKNMELYWKRDNCLVINGVQYDID